MIHPRILKIVLPLLFGIAVIACTRSAESQQEMRITALEKRIEELTPGFGETMGVVQQHHAKLFYAGSSKNWDLADYQLDEIREGLEDVAKHHPKFKDVPLPIPDLVAKMMTDPLEKVGKAIHAKDTNAFLRSYVTLTNACNNCHRAAQHSFIVVQSPRSPEFTNQKFTP